MLRIHTMLQVEDLQESIRFYSALFGSEPTRRKADYAKWMLEDPRINFSISDRGETKGVEHLGIQAETPEELESLRQRIRRAGGQVFDEGETTCCYHNSDKTWITDAQGVSWEAFYTSGKTATFHAPEGARPSGPCCDDDSCSETSGEGAKSCCDDDSCSQDQPKDAKSCCDDDSCSQDQPKDVKDCCDDDCCSQDQAKGAKDCCDDDCCSGTAGKGSPRAIAC